MTDNEMGQHAKLRQPFPDHQVNLLPKQMRRDDQDKGKCERGSKYSADGRFCGGYHARSMHLDYVGHAALTDRFLEVDPAWTWEPLAVGDNGLPMFDGDGGLWIRLTICGMTRLGYGDAQGKKGPNAVKEAIGDALRNAGMRFGAALDLWHKGDLHAAADEQGQAPANTAEPFDADVHNDFMAAVMDAADKAALDKIGKQIAAAPIPNDARASLRSAFSDRMNALKKVAA